MGREVKWDVGEGGLQLVMQKYFSLPLNKRGPWLV